MNVGKLNTDLEGEVRFAKPQFVRRISLQAIEDDNAPDGAPSHRIVISDSGNTLEIGAAWPKKDKNDRRYFSCQIDQPDFDKPISFAAFPCSDAREGFDLIWNRKR